MFRKLIPLLAAPAVLGAQQVVADPNGARQVTLAEALQLAKDNNISNITAANSVRSANNSVRSARAALLPTLDASAGQSLRLGGGGQHVEGDRIVSGGQKWSYNTGLSTSLTLFDGGKMFSDIRARNADEDAAEASQTNTNFNVALQVKTQYNAALAANEQFAAANAQLAVAKQQLDMTVARVNAGAANIADSLNSIVQVGNAELAILTAQQSLRSANAGLTRLAGTSYIITATAADTIAHNATPIDSAEVMRLALEGPAIRQAQAQIGSASASLKSAKTAYFPTVGASANLAGQGQDALYGLNSNPYPYTRTVSLSLRFPIFNRFQRENSIESAQIAHENAEASLKDAKLQAQQTVITQLGLLHNAEEQVRVQENSVRANEEALRVNQQRYNLGAGTLLEVLTSQSSLVSARQGLIQARLNYRNARAQIEAVIGRDLQ
jgi:Outer membrane protein